MEIMQWVRDRVEERSWGYYLFFIFSSLLALYFAFGEIAAEIPTLPSNLAEVEWSPHLLWQFLCAASLIGIIYIWLYYAPVVRADLEHLKNAFSRDEKYLDLYDHFQGWQRQFYFNKKGKSSFLKIPYTIAWGLDVICYIYCLRHVFSQNFNECGAYLYYGLLAFFILSLTTIVLNYSSYYICVVFVYFLIRVCRHDKYEHLSFLKECPSATYGFQLLNHAANTIYLYFLLDSSLCMIGYYSFWRMIDGAKITMNGLLWAALFYLTFFFITFTWVSWAAIILLSRACLYRLHSRWKFRALEELAGKKRKHSKNDLENNPEYIERARQLAMDKISVDPLNLIISIAPLAANVVAVWSSLNPLSGPF